MIYRLRRGLWLALLGPSGYGGAVRQHTEDLFDYTYRAHREHRRGVKALARESAAESTRRLRALGISKDEIACIKARARMLPNNPYATAVFLNDALVGFSTHWRATAPVTGPNALHIYTTNGGIK